MNAFVMYHLPIVVDQLIPQMTLEVAVSSYSPSGPLTQASGQAVPRTLYPSCHPRLSVYSECNGIAEAVDKDFNALMGCRAISAVTFAMLLFELRRVAHLDRPYTPVREGSMDIFPRTAIIPHPEQRCIFFWCPSNTLFLWLQRSLTYLGICSSVMRDWRF